MFWILAATGTAAAFAASSMVAYEAARKLGGVVFSFMRTTLAAIGFLVVIAVTGWDWTLSQSDILLVATSGFSGAFLADALRYAALARLGPRVNALIQTSTVPFSLACGAIMLGQPVTGTALIGTLIVFLGIVIAVAFQTSGPTLWEGDPHRRKAGLLLGLGSALSFSVSLLVAAPVMAHGADPICATAIRALAGSLATFIPAILLRRNRRQMMELTPRMALQVIGSGILGTGVGLTAQLYALKNGPVGVVSALSSTTPVVMLPLIWMASRQRPAAIAWIGASLAVLGIAVISLFYA